MKQSLHFAASNSATDSNPQVVRTKQSILRAARHLMVEDGVRAITIDAVSVLSGSSRSTIYRHWPHIDDLLFSAFAELLGEPFESPNTGDFRKDLLLINRLYMDSAGDSIWMKILPSFIEISQNDQHCADLLATLVANMRQSSSDILKHAIKDGTLRPDANIDWMVDVISGAPTYRMLLSKASLEEDGYLEFLIEAATRPYLA